MASSENPGAPAPVRRARGVNKYHAVNAWVFAGKPLPQPVINWFVCDPGGTIEDEPEITGRIAFGNLGHGRNIGKSLAGNVGQPLKAGNCTVDWIVTRAAPVGRAQ